MMGEDDAEELDTRMSEDRVERGGRLGEQDISTSTLPRLPSGAGPGSVNEGGQTPDLPCPKCGRLATEMIYCNAVVAWREQMDRDPLLYAQTWKALGPWYRDAAGKDRPCYGPSREHFERSCPRCEYRWITEDVVTG